MEIKLLDTSQTDGQTDGRGILIMCYINLFYFVRNA